MSIVSKNIRVDFSSYRRLYPSAKYRLIGIAQIRSNEHGWMKMTFMSNEESITEKIRQAYLNGWAAVQLVFESKSSKTPMNSDYLMTELIKS